MNPRRTRRPWSRTRWVATIGAVLALVALASWLVVILSSTPAQQQETEVVAVTRSTETVSVSLAGTLAPQEQANVSFAVPGTVHQIAVRVGDQVQQGQVLALLEDRDLANAVALAEAQVSAARAQLTTIREADQATSAQIAAAQAQVQASVASLDSARGRLADANLTAPLTGTVAQVNLRVGDQVTGAGAVGGSTSGFSGLSGLSGLGAATSTSAGAHVVIVVPDAWQLEASVGTADLPLLAPGQPAVVTPTGTDEAVDGFVDTIGIVATSASGSAATFPVSITLTGQGRKLFSGASAEAVVTVETIPDALTVPVTAVTTVDGRSTVQKVTGASTAATEVTLGRRFGERVEISAGLAVGDQIVAPKGLIVSAPPRPAYGPNGTFASPDPTGTP